ncbi:MAG: stage III sporulation AC/AD family protein [Ruthenibacterium sp.]
MEVLKLFGFAIAALFLYSILRQYNQTYAVVLSLTCCTVLLIFALNAAEPLLLFARKLSAYTQWGDFSAVFKAVAIALLTQCTQDLCRESGQVALAGRVEFAGKVAMLLCAMPLFASLADIIMELLQ